jgi:hypothetical protein
MTRNFLRLPCHCHKCAGASKDYRTVQLHAEREIADRPLFLAPQESRAEENNNAADNDSYMDEGIQPEDDPGPAVPHGALEMDDIVSHVESLPNCNDPIYETVP